MRAAPSVQIKLAAPCQLRDRGRSGCTPSVGGIGRVLQWCDASAKVAVLCVCGHTRRKMGEDLLRFVSVWVQDLGSGRCAAVSSVVGRYLYQF